MLLPAALRIFWGNFMDKIRETEFSRKVFENPPDGTEVSLSGHGTALWIKIR